MSRQKIGGTGMERVPPKFGEESKKEGKQGIRPRLSMSRLRRAIQRRFDMDQSSDITNGAVR